jgi:hypothetical protein
MLRGDERRSIIGRKITKMKESFRALEFKIDDLA